MSKNVGVKIKTPRGQIVTIKMPNGTVQAKLEWNPGFADRMNTGLDKTQVFIDSEVLRLCDPYVPFDTGVLKLSGTLGTDIGSGLVQYNAPYAAAQYYRNGGINGLRGPRWFDRMKADHLDEILDGAAQIAGGEATK